MKKKLIIIVIILVLVLVGLLVGFKIYNKNLDAKREKQFVEAATKYYDSYMSTIIGVDSSIVSLDMLRNAIEKNDETYEIDSLKECNKNSEVIFTLEKGKITDKKININCK